MSRAALLIGIDAYPASPLHGCVNDVWTMRSLLVGRRGFADADVEVMLDAGATTATIRGALRALVARVRPGDTAAVHFSGHGTSLPFPGPDGNEHVEDCICPVDFDSTSDTAIGARELREIFSRLPRGADVVFTSDACHAGRLLGRPVRGRLFPSRPVEMGGTRIPPGQRERSAAHSSSPGARRVALRHVAEGLEFALLAACKADQIADEIWVGGRPNGAFTYFLSVALERCGDAARLDAVVREAAGMLRSWGYDQDPQAEGERAILERPFLASRPSAVRHAAPGANREGAMSTFRVKDLMIKVLPTQRAAGRDPCDPTCLDNTCGLCSQDTCGCTAEDSCADSTCGACSADCSIESGCGCSPDCSRPCTQGCSGPCSACTDCSEGCTALCSGGCSNPCSVGCTHPSCHCSAASGCGPQPCTGPSPPGDVRSVAQIRPEHLPALRAQLQARLAAVDKRQQEIEESQRPKTVAEIEALEEKLQESLAELGRLKAELAVKGAPAKKPPGGAAKRRKK